MVIGLNGDQVIGLNGDWVGWWKKSKKYYSILNRGKGDYKKNLPDFTTGQTPILLQFYYE